MAEFKKHQPRVCGPYFRVEPATNPKGMFFYLDSDFMPGLRWEWCDEVSGSHIRHTGWFSDDFQDQTIRGIVMRLPHGRGFLAGWSMGKGMASNLEYYVWDDAVDCARAADQMADRAAEDQREHEAREREEEGADEN